MESLISDSIVSIFQWIGVLFNFVFGLFLILAGFLVDAATTYNFKILDSSNTILNVGWLAARDIANLGFVILALGSALATVLRYPADYDIRRLLPKFVAAAILVNFSMTLVAIPIQFSNVLTGFFLSRVTSVNGGSGDISIDLSGPLVGILGPQKLLIGESDPLPPDPSDSSGGAISAAIFTSLATLIFNIIFTLLMAILLLAFAAMLIGRYFALTFLIIFAPIACLAFVFPALKGALGLWTKSYSKWAVLGPSMMFFVYMAIVVAENLPGKTLTSAGNIGITGIGAIVEQFINLSFVTAILMFGLIMAGQSGTAAGNMALGAANALGDGAKKFIKDRKNKFMEGGAKTALGQKLQKTFTTASESLDIKEGDGFGKKLLKKSVALTGFGQGVAAIGGNKKGLYGTLTNEALIGAKLKDKKEKSPESKKDVEKKLGELYKDRATMAAKGLKTKDIDEEIKTNERKLYKFRREELEADYAQQDINKTNEAIQKIGRGEKSGKPKEEGAVESEFNLKLGDLSDEQISKEKELQETLKKLVKGVEDPAEKGKIIETASKEKIEIELKAVKERIEKLKKLKEDKNRKFEDVEQDALNTLQSAEYQLNTAIKKREEEIQILGSIRNRRQNAQKQFTKAMEGSINDEAETEEEEEYKYGTNEDGEEKTV